MTEQQQIDYLKQQVAKLTHTVNILMEGKSYEYDRLQNSYPSCGKCGLTMYPGMTCSNKASECPMGIGVNNDQVD